MRRTHGTGTMRTKGEAEERRMRWAAFVVTWDATKHTSHRRVACRKGLECEGCKWLERIHSLSRLLCLAEDGTKFGLRTRPRKILQERKGEDLRSLA